MSATAIPGPRALTSCKFPNMAMSPISVPIIPNDGANSVRLSNTALFALCLSSKFPISVSSIALTNSGSVPSTTSCIALRIKSLSTSATSASRERSPSRLAFSAKLTIICTIPTRSGSLNVNTFFMQPPIALSLSPGLEIIVAPIAPPIVIIREGTSKYAPMLPPEAIDAMTRIHVARNPIRLVKSNVYAPLPFYDSSAVFAIMQVYPADFLKAIIFLYTSFTFSRTTYLCPFRRRKTVSGVTSIVSIMSELRRNASPLRRCSSIIMCTTPALRFEFILMTQIDYGIISLILYDFEGKKR